MNGNQAGLRMQARDVFEFCYLPEVFGLSQVLESSGDLGATVFVIEQTPRPCHATLQSMHDTQADYDFNLAGESTYDAHAANRQEVSGNLPDDADNDPGTRALEASPTRGRVRSLDNEALALLIGRIMRHDQAALAELYQCQSARVYSVALHITRQVACAEEVLQDTFWQVWRQAPLFDPSRGCATAWLLAMARSRAMDAMRAKIRDPVQLRGPVVPETVALGDSPTGDPLDLMQALQRNSHLHAALTKLDPLRRQLVALAFYRGLTHIEIALHMGLPLGTVKTHFRRALAALRKALGPKFGLHQGRQVP